jgi:type II secretory pathway pseudopilin PulG
VKALRAVTLIEVMVAGAILAIVLASTAGAMAFGFSTASHTRRVAAAERAAASHLEALMLEDERRPLPARGSVRLNEEGQQDPDGLFTSTWALDPNRPVPGAFRLAVEVTWSDGLARRLRLVTYLPERRR